MHCIAISDLHGHLPRIAACDLLAIAGDICPHRYEPGSPEDVAFQGEWLETIFRPWLLEAPARHVLAVAGNHDFVFERRPGAVPSLPWTLLLDGEVEVEGRRVYGTPRQLPYGNWAYSAPEDELSAIFATASPRLDLLISHGPPYGCGDRAQTTHLHVGSHALHKLIRSRRPAFVVTGHLHGSYGIYWPDEHRGTCVINASLADWNYVPAHDPIAFEL